MLSPYLDAIELRLDRAEAHAGELNNAISEWRALDPYRITIEDDPERADRVRYRLRVDAPLPAEFAVIVGDVVHSLRSCLDYLVNGLVFAGGSSPSSHTAFPVWRKDGAPGPNDMPSMCGHKAKGASQEVIEQLCALEPYEGGNGEALWLLDHLDVVDKHRLLILAGSAHRSAGINMAAHFRESWPDDSPVPDVPDIFVHIRPADSQFPLQDGDILLTDRRFEKEQHEPEFAIDIALGEPDVIKGQAVVPLLGDLRQAVVEVIDLFRPALG